MKPMRLQYHLINMWVFTIIFCSCSPQEYLKKEKDTFRKAAEKWVSSINTGDVNGIAESFSVEVVAMYPDGLPVVGRDANRKTWQRVYSSPNNTHPLTIERLEMAESGELGYIYGKWWSIKPDIDFYTGGRYMAVWIRINGKWQLEMLSANDHEDIKAESPPAK